MSQPAPPDTYINGTAIHAACPSDEGHRPQTADNPDPHFSRQKGLCTTCLNLDKCVLADPRTVTWFCEEYQ